MPSVNISDLSVEALTKMIEQVAAASAGTAEKDPQMIAAIEAVAQQVARKGGNNPQIQAALAAVRQALSGET